MFKSIKKALATLSVLALLVSNVQVAFAQTFNDVPTDAWYYDYVEQLVSDGVIEARDTYRPNDGLIRAEIAKIVIMAVDGLADYEAPATPTFDDVAPDAWYYDYVEAAVQLGIVKGYTDAAGNLTGKFGPTDTVSRAQATKILVNAFAVPTTLTPASPFPDVTEGAWYYDYVVTAYNQSILDGYANGMFGSADPVTRAQVAKLVVNSQNPVERAPGEGEGEGEGEGAGVGALEASLNDTTAPSSTLPQAATSVRLVSWDFTAADDDVSITNLVVTRGGVGKVGDWDALYLYDGSKRLTTGRTINSDTNTSTFSLNLLVEAGTTTTITLVGDVAQPPAPGASNQHYFYVASSADVTSNAASTAGDFPVAGNTFTIGGNATVVNDLTVVAGTAPSQPTIGQKDAEIASIKLTAGATNDIAIHSLALTQGGSLGTEKMENLRLLRGTDEVATTAAFDGDRVTFVLTTPFIIPKGQNKTFYVHTDINGGRTTDTIKLYLDENTDVTAIDQQYGYGAIIINNFNAGVSLTLKGGDVTVTDNGPAASQIAQNTTNVHLLDFGITAARDLTVRETFIDVTISNAGGTGPNISAVTTDIVIASGAGTLASFPVTGDTSATIAVGDMVQIDTNGATAGGDIYYCVVTSAASADPVTTNCSAGIVTAAGLTATEVNPYDYLKNVRLVDIDSGRTLAGPNTTSNSGATLVAGPPGHYTKVYSEDYELTGGETRHISVQADVNTNMAAGYQVKAGVRYSDGVSISSYLKDLAANEFVATSNIVGAGATALQGKWMTTAANSLTAGLAATPSSQTFVKGDDKVPALGMALKAGDAGDITIKKLTVRVYGNTAAATPWAAITGDTAANTLVSSVMLYDGNDVVDGPRSLTLVDNVTADGAWTAGEYYKVLFDNLNLKVAKGSSKTFVAKAKLLNTMGTTTYVAIDMVPANDIAAEDADANTITASGTALNGAVAHLPLLTVLTAGTLTAYSEGNPDARNVIDGSNMQLVAKYRFKALREAFTVNKVTIVNDLATDFGDAAVSTPAVTNVTIKYKDINGATQAMGSSLSGGTATLSGLGLYVPNVTDSFMEIYADVASLANTPQDLSGMTFRLGLQNTGNSVSTFEAIGASSSSSEYFLGAPSPSIANSSEIKQFVVRNTIPVFSKASGLTATLNNSELTFYGLSVTADSGGPAGFARLVFDITTSGLNVAGGDIYGFKVYKDTTPINSADVNIYCPKPIDLQASVAGAGLEECDAVGNDNLIADGTYQVIVSFDTEQTIDVSASRTFKLIATAKGVGTTDSVTTKLNTGDENTPVTGIPIATAVGCGVGSTEPCSSGTNGNTGLIYDTGGALFTAAATDFRQLLGTARNIIWSDKSADNHGYPTVTAGSVTQCTDTVPITLPGDCDFFDWSNGYLLQSTTLTSHTLAYSG